MKLAAVIKAAGELRSSSGLPDIDSLCRDHGIILLYYPMGSSRLSVKGFIIESSGKVCITISSDLSDDMRKVVFYHEFAHYILHIRTGLCEHIHDTEVYDAASRAEYEANLLAAELEITDAEAMTALRSSGSFYEAAGLLRVPPELLEYKVRLLKYKGFAVNDAPIAACGTYLAAFSEGAV